MVATAGRRLPGPTGVIISGRRWRPVGAARVIATGRRSAGVARVVTPRWRWRLSRPARVVAARWRWLVVVGRRRLVTCRRWWRRRRRSGRDVAGAAGHRRRAVVDVVIRIERTADALSGAVVGARAFGIGWRRWRTREIAGVVRARITQRRRRRRIVIAHWKQVPLRELAPGIGRGRRRTGRIRRVVGTQVRRERTAQRCGLDCQRGVVQAADPER
jgi:hypothetical protein